MRVAKILCKESTYFLIRLILFFVLDLVYCKTFIFVAAYNFTTFLSSVKSIALKKYGSQNIEEENSKMHHTCTYSQFSHHTCTYSQFSHHTCTYSQFSHHTCTYLQFSHHTCTLVNLFLWTDFGSADTHLAKK